MNGKQDFSKRLRQALRDAGVDVDSPTRLALEFNLHHHGAPVTAQAVRKWLGGSAIPAHDRLLTLADWLSVSSEWLRFGDSRTMEVRQERAAYKAVDLRLYGDLQRLSSEHKRVVQAVIAALLRIERQ